MTKAPTQTEMSKGQVASQTTPQKSSIKQQLRTDLGRVTDGLKLLLKQFLFKANMNSYI